MIDSILKGFDVWTDAQGVKSKGRVKSIDNISLEGIARLRELILDFAIKGKLVPQRNEEGSAEDLFKKINIAREKLIKEGKVKKYKPKTIEAEKEENSQLPVNWKLTSLIDVFDVRDGTHDSPKYQSDGYPLITSKNLYNGQLDFNDVNYISEIDHLKISERSKVERYDILFAMIGSIGNPVIVDTDREFSIKNVALFKYYDKDLSCPEFLQIFLKHAAVEMKAKALGGVQSFVSLGLIREFKFYLPPLEEQKRIITKVNELMSICDRLEEEKTKNLSTHQNLVKSLLENLTRAKDADELQTAWAKLSEHFDTLFCTEDSIEQLKETILQLALRGKLTNQDQNDENADYLRKKIVSDFEKLAKAGKAKKPVTVAEIKEEEKPFALPNNWAWVRLQEIIQISSGDGLTASNMNTNGEIPVYGGNGVNGYHDKYNVIKPTLVIGRVGYYCGSIHITPPYAWVTDNAFITTFSEENISIDFLYWLLKGTNLKENDNATAQPVISGRKIYPIVVALPPFNEQNRIVEQIVLLFSLCDNLKIRIEKSQEIKEVLSQTVIATAI
ncbi:MAG TPA: restriction endonuclease subunit S [Saprospiraceae bacterium]|nr:restriction endonuclease subunit S [Saprospiraceae bacterium]